MRTGAGKALEIRVGFSARHVVHAACMVTSGCLSGVVIEARSLRTGAGKALEIRVGFSARHVVHAACKASKRLNFPWSHPRKVFRVHTYNVVLPLLANLQIPLDHLSLRTPPQTELCRLSCWCCNFSSHAPVRIQETNEGMNTAKLSWHQPATSRTQ